MMRLAVERGTGTAAQISGWSIGGKTGTGETGVPARTRPGSSPSPAGRREPARARDRCRAAEPERHGRNHGSADRPRRHGGNPAGHGESLTSRNSSQPCDPGHPLRHPLRRALPDQPQARRRRDGRRLPRGGPGARSPGRGQDPPRALRERRPVRRALPARGDARRRSLAPEHRLDLRPRRDDGSYFIVMEYVEGRTLKELIRSRGRAPSPSRSRTRARSSPRSATRTGTASSTATSSRTT